jgi:hypothetical protein
VQFYDSSKEAINGIKDGDKLLVGGASNSNLCMHVLNAYRIWLMWYT